MPAKSEEELRKEQEEAKKQLEQLFASSRPKNMRQGVGHGMGNILGGAVGGAGIAVLAPPAGLAMGLRSGGLLGGIVGLTGGAVVGVLGGVAVAVSGVASGLTSIVRGVAAMPAAVSANLQGKWWNEASHQWVHTNLPEDAAKVPANDDDLLKKLEQDVDNAAANDTSATVKDPFYYDVLELKDYKADAHAIKHQYYKLAREYHPDKKPGDAAAAAKFKDIAEAYQILSDEDLRKKYDTDGKEGISADGTSTVDQGKPDPSILLAFLFGSDKFQNYIGRLATSTSAMLGDSPKITLEQARTLQERRCTRLAVKLVEKIDTDWVANKDYDACQRMWESEAAELVQASYGWELLQSIGMAYEVAAEQFLGSAESGIGLPSIGNWAAAQSAKWKKSKARQQNQMEQLMATMDAMQVKAEFDAKMAAAQNDGERLKLQRELEDATQNTMLKLIWSTTVVDITSTIHEACQMVFFDQAVDKEAHKARAAAVKKLGEIFQAVPEPKLPEGVERDARSMFEEAALGATVETMKRKDEAQFGARSSVK